MSQQLSQGPCANCVGESGAVGPQAQFYDSCCDPYPLLFCCVCAAAVWSGQRVHGGLHMPVWDTHVRRRRVQGGQCALACNDLPRIFVRTALPHYLTGTIRHALPAAEALRCRKRMQHRLPLPRGHNGM